jgi:hypothetical protein
MNYPLVCVPVAMYPRPPAKSTQHNCDDCAEPVWVAHSAPAYSRLVCLDCYKEQARPGDVVLPPTEEQVRDFKEQIAAIKKERLQ